MANTIKLKRGTSTPTTSDLSNGEVGLDTSAKKLFVNDNGTIKEIGGVTSPNFIYLELRNASNNGAASYPNNDFTLVIAGTTTAQTVGAANQLLVSVSGVIQQPNSGTSTSGITGFIVDGNRFKTATNLPSAPDFIIFQKAGGIGEPSDGSVTSAKLSSSINSQITANTAKVTNATHTGEVTGSTALTIADNVVDEANLKVSNSPTNGYFLSAQSGNTGGLTWAEVTSDLVGDSSPQLGGDLDSNGNNITLGDNDRIRLGAGNRLDIYHDSSSGNSFIKETGSGSLVINANDFFVQNVATETMIKAASDGAVELYYDNTKMLETYSNGVKIHQGANSHLWLNDNANLRLGTGNDLRLFHDGSDSYIDETGTGDLKIRSSSGIQLQKDSEKYLACVPDGSVELYHDNSMKLQTLADGYSVVGAIFGGTIQSPVPSSITFNSNSFTPAAMFYPEGGYGNNNSPSNNRQCLIVGNTKGNWNDGNSSSSHRSNGLRFSRILNGSEKLRAGIAHDIQGIEKFKFWTSYGDIHFRTRNGNDGDQTWEECDKDPLVLHHNGHVSMCNMPRLYWTLAQSASSYSHSTTQYVVTGGSASASHGMSINTGTGAITIPYAGVYMVNASIGLHSNSSTNQRLDMRVGGTDVIRTEQHNSQGWHTHHIHSAYSFNANDSVDFRVVGRTDGNTFSVIDITLLHGTATT